MATQSRDATIVDLDEEQAEVVDEATDGEDDDGEDEDPPLGEPFALSYACELLPQERNIPGCWASVRCDCGRGFKVDLLSAGVKRCPGCSIEYSHVLLVAPADDPQIVTDFLDSIHGEPAEDDDDAEGEKPYRRQNQDDGR